MEDGRREEEGGGKEEGRREEGREDETSTRHYSTIKIYNNNTLVQPNLILEDLYDGRRETIGQETLLMMRKSLSHYRKVTSIVEKHLQNKENLFSNMKEAFLVSFSSSFPPSSYLSPSFSLPLPSSSLPLSFSSKNPPYSPKNPLSSSKNAPSSSKNAQNPYCSNNNPLSSCNPTSFFSSFSSHPPPTSSCCPLSSISSSYHPPSSFSQSACFFDVRKFVDLLTELVMEFYQFENYSDVFDKFLFTKGNIRNFALSVLFEDERIWKPIFEVNFTRNKQKVL